MSSHRLILFLLTSCLVACTPRSVREAQDVVARADSCWQAGQPYADSACLARSFHTLEHWQWCCPDDYAHACYHYGRLLREKENPVAAMECFIHATHSRSRDYHILGRVYSNIGDLCHLAMDYSLAYEMYQQSANCFLKNGDTILHYYGLYSMAFELATLNKRDSSFVILDSIRSHKIKEDFLTACCYLVEAKAYYMDQQYISSIYYANLSLQYGYNISTSQLILAQSYSCLGIKDSAQYYASVIANESNQWNENYNALYILSRDTPNVSIDSLLTLTSNRADIQKLWTIRQGKLSQAVQLLEQDLDRKPNWTWLYAIIVTIIIIGISSGAYIHKNRRKHRLLSQKINDLKQETTAIQVKHNNLKEHYKTHHKLIEDEINNKCSLLRKDKNLAKTLEWKNYSKMCKIVDSHFYLLASKLRNKHTLNEREVRLCILTLLDCGYNQIAELLYYAPNGVGKLKMRVAKKLGTTVKGLRQYLIDNECIK